MRNNRFIKIREKKRVVEEFRNLIFKAAIKSFKKRGNCSKTVLNPFVDLKGVHEFIRGMNVI